MRRAFARGLDGARERVYIHHVEYEWDESKNVLNVAEHGFDFSDAWQIFDDPHRITFADGRKDYGEAYHGDCQNDLG